MAFYKTTMTLSQLALIQLMPKKESDFMYYCMAQVSKKSITIQLCIRQALEGKTMDAGR